MQFGDLGTDAAAPLGGPEHFVLNGQTLGEGKNQAIEGPLSQFGSLPYDTGATVLILRVNFT